MSETYGTVDIKIDPALHPADEKPDGPGDEMVWAYLDTAYNLLREASVRSTIQAAREAAEGFGITDFPTDEELFADPDLIVEGVRGYLDLAPDHPVAASGLLGAFSALEKLAADTALRGLEDAIAE